MLCYLELECLIKVYLPTRTKCSIVCYEGAQQMVQVIKKCPAVAAGLDQKSELKRFIGFGICPKESPMSATHKQFTVKTYQLDPIEDLCFEEGVNQNISY